MKKSIIFAATLLLLTMVSCNKDSLTPSENPLTWDGGTRAEKNPLDEIDFSALDTVYFVTDKDVEAYIHFKELLAKGQGKEFAVQEVVPMGLNDEATLAYLLNYNEGWEIISADKRAPVVLASGEVESFSLKEVPENVIAWIECLESDVLSLRLCKDRPEWAEDEVWEKMLSSIDIWLAINADNSYIARSIEGARVEPGEGHWELYSVSSTTVLYDSLRHLTTTAWNQESPYNNYLPYRTDHPTERAWAGCSAVACAQMLFYLHKTYGYPVSTPRTVYCTGHVPSSHYTITLSTELSSTIWDEMFEHGEFYWNPQNAKDSAAVLIATAGKLLNVSYKNDGGHLTDNNRIKNDFFNYYGISCTKAAYNSSTVKTELLRGMPVIVSAYSNDVNPLGIHLYYTGGHIWLIDGYKRSRTQTTYTYLFVYPENTPRPDEPEYRIEVTYSSPFITKFKMNWGEAYQYNNYDFEMTGNWTIQGDNYQYDRTMFTGFSNNN